MFLSLTFYHCFFNGSCVLRMAIATHRVGLIVIFVVGIPYYWLAIFTIELINGFNCTMARTLSTRELRPAECAKRLNNKICIFSVLGVFFQLHV